MSSVSTRPYFWCKSLEDAEDLRDRMEGDYTITYCPGIDRYLVTHGPAPKSLQDATYPRILNKK